MAGITQPKPGERVNANGVWDLSQNKGKMTVFSLCLLLCADLLDLAVGKSYIIYTSRGIRSDPQGRNKNPSVDGEWGDSRVTVKH